MHRGKGMKFVGDSRIPAEKKTEYTERLFRVSWKDRGVLAELPAERMDGRGRFPRRISRFNDCARAAFGTGGGPDGYRIYSAAGLVFSIFIPAIKI